MSRCSMGSLPVGDERPELGGLVPGGASPTAASEPKPFSRRLPPRRLYMKSHDLVPLLVTLEVEAAAVRVAAGLFERVHLPGGQAVE
jgi:hypothetical protein